jgi:hypothetical protein
MLLFVSCLHVFLLHWPPIVKFLPHGGVGSFYPTWKGSNEESAIELRVLLIDSFHAYCSCFDIYGFISFDHNALIYKCILS